MAALNFLCHLFLVFAHTVDFLRLLSFGSDGRLLLLNRLADLSVVLLGLVLRFEAGPAHCIDAFRVEWVPCTEVGLCELLALAEELDGCVVVTQFFMLLSHAKMGHDLDSYEVI